jgi:tRNA threonylcarbamoyladenosine biosynthesis protein TsaE
VYRLDRVQDVVDLGLDELGDGEALLLVEWGDAVEALLPADHLTIELTTDVSDEARTLVLEAAGGSWADRWPALELALDPWQGP